MDIKLDEFFKSLAEVDDTSIIICDLNHTIIYMNKLAKEVYAKKGIDLMGKNLLNCHNAESVKKIKDVLEWFQKDENNNFVHTFYNEKQNKDGYMVALRNSQNKLIGYYEKHEYRNRDFSPFYDLK